MSSLNKKNFFFFNCFTI